jgi:hypothetical protein
MVYLNPSRFTQNEPALLVHGGRTRDGNRLVTVGDTWLYLIKSRIWRPLGVAFPALHSFDMVVVDEYVFLFGGLYANQMPNDKVFRWDLRRNVCKAFTPLGWTCRISPRVLVLNRGKKNQTIDVFIKGT